MSPLTLAPPLLHQLAKRHGWRLCQPLNGGQHTVWQVQIAQRQAVVKVRRAKFSRRLTKEAHWLRQVAKLGIKSPTLLDHIQDQDGHALVLGFVPRSGKIPLSPNAIMATLRPLHAQSMGPGWGTLRADGQPRWRDEHKALHWYQKLCAAWEHGDHLSKLLETTWPHRQRGLTHGDCHRGNQLGDYLLDWEHVAQVDPYEEAARIALARAWPQPWQWVGSSVQALRWRGAWLRSCLESAAYPGPRHERAQIAIKQLHPILFT